MEMVILDVLIAVLFWEHSWPPLAGSSASRFAVTLESCYSQTWLELCSKSGEVILVWFYMP